VKKGDIIHGYRVVTEVTNAGGGRCVWGFAEKHGRTWFLKQFLEPKMPRNGSAMSVWRRLEECREFEDRHRTIMARLRPDMPGAGNLVLATDFFREGSTFYKVTERVDVSSLDRPHLLPPAGKAVLLRTLVLSVRCLHGIGVVHGDLKPANVLVQKRPGRTFHAAKVIDFDDSYLSGRPPEPSAITGDSLYGAPEWRRYLRDDGDVPAVPPAALTTAVDVFALGLLAHGYLTGGLPRYGGRHGSPGDAVNAGGRLVLSERLHPAMRTLLRSMVAADPGDRPPLDTVLVAWGDDEVFEPAAGRPPGSPSRLRINLGSHQGEGTR
jgi:eukaryotic-like serine/threonine-protein kinase